MTTRFVRHITLVAVVAAAACAKGRDESTAAGEITRGGSLSASAASSHGPPLDQLASSVTAGADLACTPPHGPINKANELARRAAVHCSNTKNAEDVPSDTLVLISKDSGGHALTVVRLWLPNATTRDEYEGLAKELTASYGSPAHCANPGRGTSWRANDLDVSIDTLFAGGALRWRVSLAVGTSPCASIK